MPSATSTTIIVLRVESLTLKSQQIEKVIYGQTPRLNCGKIHVIPRSVLDKTHRVHLNYPNCLVLSPSQRQGTKRLIAPFV